MKSYGKVNLMELKRLFVVIMWGLRNIINDPSNIYLALAMWTYAMEFSWKQSWPWNLESVEHRTMDDERKRYPETRENVTPREVLSDIWRHLHHRGGYSWKYAPASSSIDMIAKYRWCRRRGATVRPYRYVQECPRDYKRKTFEIEIEVGDQSRNGTYGTSSSSSIGSLSAWILSIAVEWATKRWRFIDLWRALHVMKIILMGV